MYLDLGLGHFVFVFFFFFSVIVAILTERCNYNHYCSFDKKFSQNSALICNYFSQIFLTAK